MLLTLKQPPHTHGFKAFHDYAPPTPPSTTARYSPVLSSAASTYPPPVAPAARKLSSEQPMSTPHRGLPPPAAMTLPPPGPSSQQSMRDSSALVQSQSIGKLPDAPQQGWHGEGENMRHWLHAKAEEDKRKQEEERTRQETLRLEQRRIEHTILERSLEGGIPPYMIPIVFAGMGGSMQNDSMQFAERLMMQAGELQRQQMQLQEQSSITRPDSPRPETRTMSHAYPPGQHPIAATLPSSTPTAGPGSSSVFAAGYNMDSPNSRARQLPGPSALPGRAPQTAQLSRLNTGEMQIHPPPQAPSQTLVGQPLQSQAGQDQEAGQSSELYFHHWQPPNTQTGGSGSNQATTNEQAANSPKKRKAEGPQRPAPPPTSQPQYHSPQYSQTGSSQSGPSGTPGRRQRGHSRSERGSLEYPRQNRRHHHNDSETNSQIGISPDQQGFMPPQDGPISSRRNTLQMSRDDRNDPRQQPIHLQHHQQHQHQYQSQPPLQSQPSHQHHQQSHYNDRNIYQSGPDLRRESARGGERSPDQDREMSSRMHTIKRDERD